MNYVERAIKNIFSTQFYLDVMGSLEIAGVQVGSNTFTSKSLERPFVGAQLQHDNTRGQMTPHNRKLFKKLIHLFIYLLFQLQLLRAEAQVTLSARHHPWKKLSKNKMVYILNMKIIFDVTRNKPYIVRSSRSLHKLYK